VLGRTRTTYTNLSSTERLWRRYTSHFLGFIPHYLLHERDQIIRVYLDADARTVYNAPGACTLRQLAVASTMRFQNNVVDSIPPHGAVMTLGGLESTARI